ncbi:hypothetical protein NL50_00095 [Clostridium acetobutylicum]|nr:hypothetical protein NL50_00095 [Clostridium acetobutylicum]
MFHNRSVNLFSYSEIFIKAKITYVIRQTTGVALSVLVAPGDIGAAAGKASKAESLLGKVGTFSKSVAVSSAKNAENILAKVKGTVSDFWTASAALAKAFGKTYVEESGKYANIVLGGFGAAGAGVEVTYKAAKEGLKEAKSVSQKVKIGQSGFCEVAADAEKSLSRIDKDTLMEVE